MFESLLIANRGEIARRIIRTARRMGLRTIAVYSDADAAAPHVAEADEAVRIGPAAARDSYLRIDAILDAARQTSATAIHPGYGFLSERPDFPAACAAAGIDFVGPPAEVVAAMGSKIAAKRLAVAAGVPVVPGFDADTGDDAALVAAAAGVGFPLLVKASAGGGGKGMRVVEGAGDLAEAIATARREARAAFGDDRLLLERLVRSARHVEVQVAADHHGAVVHLFERDCSVQRNNQKVFEEAPAPNLADAIRSRLYDDAVRLARSIGYRNLGTMEFLVDAATGEHFFLEMNTRLQVEHPVTEMITGLDLVEWQLRIAAGEPLPLAQEAIHASGHAIEARLLAERPEAGFMPASGRVALWREPAPRPGCASIPASRRDRRSPSTTIPWWPRSSPTARPATPPGRRSSAACRTSPSSAPTPTGPSSWMSRRRVPSPRARPPRRCCASASPAAGRVRPSRPIAPRASPRP